MTPERIQAVIDVLVINRDSVELMQKRGVDPLDVLAIGALATKAGETKTLSNRLAAIEADRDQYRADYEELVRALGVDPAADEDCHQPALDSLAKLKAENERLAAVAADMVVDYGQLQIELDAVQRELVDMKQELRTKITWANDADEARLRDIKNLTDLVFDARKQVANARAANAQLKRDKDVPDAWIEIARLTAENDRLTSQLATKNQTIEELSSAVDEAMDFAASARGTLSMIDAERAAAWRDGALRGFAIAKAEVYGLEDEVTAWHDAEVVLAAELAKR